MSIFPGFSSLVSSWLSLVSESSDCFDVYHAIIPERSEPIRNKVFGIPGTKPNSNRTAETGTHAFDKPIWFEICPAKSSLSEEILVTIVAVAMANNNEGIWATRPSPTVNRI